MSVKNKLQNAISLLTQGHRKDAATELLVLEPIIVDKNLRIQLIDAMLSALDSVENNDMLIKLSNEGIGIAGEYNRKDLQAFFMSRNADFLMINMTFLQYDRDCLKLSPGWTEFSTEVDKEKYEKLTAEIKRNENEIDHLLNDALVLADQSGDRQTGARILMTSAGIESLRYLNYKGECMRSSLCAKLWLRFEFIRYPFYERLFVSSNSEKKKLNNLVMSFTEKFIKAAQILEGLNDSMAGYAYHNLANDLKSAYKFKKAKKYLSKAKAIAEKHNDQLLNKQVELLEKAIKARNKDIPDYINGETRDG